MTWLPIIIYIAIFILIGYFLLFRPQKKRKQQEEELRSSLMLGDEITTIGGICGKIVNIKDDNITIESSIDRTLMEVKNWAVRDVKKLVTDDDKIAADNKK
ncbi:MAG: preprotein translocase subunit YajC [Clostridia bacterium]|nr:preprotein translocase subunit YajC [Clostridia bacterium]MBQ3866977.1 preprotein translocase subunit YajC [Clostridia bacterium]MBR7063244.1 preprotein translocase subunit YajC [Clostridia bacterium]